MPAKVATLRIRLADDSIEELEVFSGDSLNIGRTKDNQLVLKGTKVSRRHAVINASSLGLIFSDLNSLNGSFLNKRRITSPEKLSDRDELLIGNCMISVRLMAEEAGVKEEDAVQTQAASMEKATVTVLLADVRSYTSMSEQFPIENVSNALQAWLAGVSEIIRKHGGTVDKYIGDCVMSFFSGEPSESKTLAKSAVECSKEIISYTKKFSNSENWAHQASSEWRCGVSINSGEAMLGGLGAKELRDFTILGDTVNLAFRLEALFSQHDVEVIIGPMTRELLMKDYQFKSLGTEKLEGKTDLVKVFTLTSL